jgi:hypothetical protein
MTRPLMSGHVGSSMALWLAKGTLFRSCQLLSTSKAAQRPLGGGKSGAAFPPDHGACWSGGAGEVPQKEFTPCEPRMDEQSRQEVCSPDYVRTYSDRLRCQD